MTSTTAKPAARSRNPAITAHAALRNTLTWIVLGLVAPWHGLATASPATPPASEPTANAPAARVNGVAVSASTLSLLLKTRQAAAASQDGTALPTLSAQEQQMALDDLILTELLNQRAREEGLLQQPALQAEIELQKRQLLGQRLLQRLARDTVVEDSELRARYDALIPESELDTRHILLATEAQAQQAIAQLEQGTAFATLARRLSTDPGSQKKGGALGPMSAGDLTPAYAAAAQALSPGEFTRTPVQTEFGWHVIQLVRRVKQPKPPFDTMREGLRQQVVEERVSAQVKQWRDQAKLERLITP